MKRCLVGAARLADEAENSLMRIPTGAKAWSATVLLVLLPALTGCEGSGIFYKPHGDPSTSGDGNAGTSNGQAAAVPQPGVRPEAPRQSTLVARSVVGGSESDVTRILGEPQAVRNEPPAMVWHYAASSCKLDVFFYFDIRNKDFRALSYKFYPELPSLEGEQTCIASIRNGTSR